MCLKLVNSNYTYPLSHYFDQLVAPRVFYFPLCLKTQLFALQLISTCIYKENFADDHTDSDAKVFSYLISSINTTACGCANRSFIRNVARIV